MVFLPSDVARLVLSYLLENDYKETREVFMSECPALKELHSLSSIQLQKFFKVKGRKLSKILDDTTSLIDKIRELAEGISSDSEWEELQDLPPLKVLDFLAKHLGEEKTATEKEDKTSQTEIKVETKETTCQTDLNLGTFTPSVPEIIQSKEFQKENRTPDAPLCDIDTPGINREADSSRTRSAERTGRPGGSFFHPNIRVQPPPKPGPVPIRPKPKFEVNSQGNDRVNAAGREADTPLNDSNFKERLTRDEITHSTPSLRERERKTKPKKSKQSDEEFLDELLENDLLDLGQKICSLIPENVSSQNISDIAEKGANNEGIIEILNMLGESGVSEKTSETSGDSTDSRVNTPVTSPAFMEVVELAADSEQVEYIEVEEREEGDSSKGFDASLSVTHVDSNVMDILSIAVQDTIKEVTAPFEEHKAPAEKMRNKRKLKTPKPGKDQSKKVRSQEGPKVNRFRSVFRSEIRDTLIAKDKEENSKVDKQKLTNVEGKLSEENFIATISSLRQQETKKPESNEEFVPLIVGEMSVVPVNEVKIIADPEAKDRDNLVEVVRQEEKGKRRERCNKCSGCLAPPCGQCRPCKDKKINGGKGILKKGCLEKACVNLKSRKTRPTSKMEQNIENIQPVGISPPKLLGAKQQQVHVRHLVFSPPKNEHHSVVTVPVENNLAQVTVPVETRTQIKTLSPAKNISPLKRTDPAWSTNLVFSDDKQAQPQNNNSSVKTNAVSNCEPKHPNLIKKDLTDLNNPVIVQMSYPPAPTVRPSLIPISADLIPHSAVPSLPPGFRSHGYSVILNQPDGKSSAEKPGKTDLADRENNEKTPSYNIETGKQEEVKSVESKIISRSNSKGVGSKKSPINKTKPKAWDENLRAVLGSAEKDTTHISHKLSEREKKVKKSPKKIVYEQTPDSGDEENPVELALTDKDINPEAQKILDTFANNLLQKLEEGCLANVLQPASKAPAKKGKPGSEGKDKSTVENSCPGYDVSGGPEGKDCICCKMEGVIKGKKKSDDRPLSLSGLDELLDTVDQVHADTAAEDNGANKTPDKKETTETDKVSLFPKQVFKTPSKTDFVVFKTPVKTAGGSLTTPLKSLEGVSPLLPNKVQSPPEQASPRRSHLSVPLTPSRSSESRVRHKSSLHTPVCTPTRQSDLDSPTTPRNKNSPALSYYTPSPSPRSQYSVPSPSYTPGLRFLQEEGDRLSQSDDSCSSPSPGAADRTQKRKSFRNLFKKATTDNAGKELGSLLEQKISSYQFSEFPEDGVEPFMSPAGHGGCDYTSSPQISLQPQTSPSLSRHASFVSPNRTCYLSPTGVALTSSVLGFHQSPHNTTGSENLEPGDDMVLTLDSDEDDMAKVGQTAEVNNVAAEAADDTAVADPEETVAAVKVYMEHSVLNLSDESNTLSNHVRSDVEIRKAAAVASVKNISNVQLSEDESDEEESPSPSKIEVNKNNGSNTEEKKFVTFTPRKPRRVALISTKRKSPIKNGSTRFETQHDANNLDKNLSSNASMILDQNLGEKASIDLGLEATGIEADNEVVRKSPRKHKRKAVMSPAKDSPKTPAKKARLPEKADFTDSKELTLSFSPEKKMSEDKQSNNNPSPPSPMEEERPTTPTICKALGLQRNEILKDDEEKTIDGESVVIEQDTVESGEMSGPAVAPSSSREEKKKEYKESIKNRDVNRKASNSGKSKHSSDRSSKFSSEGSNKPSSERSSKPSSERLSKSSSERSSKSSSERSSKSSSEHSSKHSSDRSARQSYDRSSRYSSDHSARYSSDRSSRYSSDRSTIHSSERSKRHYSGNSSGSSSENSSRYSTKHSSVTKSKNKEISTPKKRERKVPNILRKSPKSLKEAKTKLLIKESKKETSSIKSSDKEKANNNEPVLETAEEPQPVPELKRNSDGDQRKEHLPKSGLSRSKFMVFLNKLPI